LVKVVIGYAVFVINPMVKVVAAVRVAPLKRMCGPIHPTLPCLISIMADVHSPWMPLRDVAISAERLSIASGHVNFLASAAGVVAPPALRFRMSLLMAGCWRALAGR